MIITAARDVGFGSQSAVCASVDIEKAQTLDSYVHILDVQVLVLCPPPLHFRKSRFVLPDFFSRKIPRCCIGSHHNYVEFLFTLTLCCS